MPIEGLEGLIPWSNVEHWLPAMMSDELPEGISVISRLRDGQPYPFILVKETPLSGSPHVDRDRARFVDVEAHCFAEGIDAEDDARDMAVACETVLRRFGDEGRLVTAAEKFADVRIVESAARRSDWSDAVSTVQYQDLPTGVERFRVQARLVIARRNRKG